MSTALKVPGQDLSFDILAGSGALGGETSDKITSSWTALGNVRSFAVLAYVTNVVTGQIVTMTVKTASDSSGTGSATLTTRSETRVLAVTGTSDATLKTLLVGECSFIPVGHSYVQVELSTDDTDGTEVVAIILARKLSD